MPTIQHSVKEYIRNRPFLEEALQRGIINHAALAEQLLPYLEKQLNKSVKFSAVNMAIRRAAEQVKQHQYSQAKFAKTTAILLRSGLTEVTFINDNRVHDLIKQVYGFVDFSQGDYLTMIQGSYEVAIITNEYHEKKIKSLFPKPLHKKSLGSLSSLTIKLTPSDFEVVGLFYLCVRALNWENINIVEIVSTLTEMTFIVSEADAARTFAILSQLIKTHSN